MGAGKKLQSLLRNKDISVTTLSRKTGISSNTLYAIIKRDSNINAETMSKIANSLHLTMDELAKLLSEDIESNSNMESNLSESRILDPEIEKSLEDSKNLIEKLNNLTKSYEEQIRHLYMLRETKESLLRRLEDINKEIKAIDMQLYILENDVQNRKTELELIRHKISAPTSPN